jgi:hypothetical protein
MDALDACVVLEDDWLGGGDTPRSPQDRSRTPRVNNAEDISGMRMAKLQGVYMGLIYNPKP